MCVYITHSIKNLRTRTQTDLLHPLNIIISSSSPCVAHRSIKGHVVRTYVGNGERMVSGVVNVENIKFLLKQLTNYKLLLLQKL